MKFLLKEIRVKNNFQHTVWCIHTFTECWETICLCGVIRDFRTTSNDAVALEALDCMYVCVRLNLQDTRVRGPFLWLEAQLVCISEGGAPLCVWMLWPYCFRRANALCWSDTNAYPCIHICLCMYRNAHLHRCLLLSPWRLKSKETHANTDTHRNRLRLKLTVQVSWGLKGLSCSPKWRKRKQPQVNTASKFASTNRKTHTHTHSVRLNEVCAWFS